ncbi:hypothetical protein IMZ31_18940 (plasmid) [Pontibacillus sp. ALD_SL1]|uniref:hypothetical protein n=1 Tax=Pontibacillus sp. ALD_SL1 TaxID=2777185 RepID=UPI001A973042|nr:hypothetical protein [Pontibacillus sp. ALD_SL1]QST02626.1 hypothetical protein IMZ31_18940 [Pontibacillus sp. ALD_SL1]
MVKVLVQFRKQNILNSSAMYPSDFLELVEKYEDHTFETWKDPFGCYEIEVEGRTLALSNEEVKVVEP